MEPKHVALMLGVAGGATVGYWAIQHMFIQGMTAEEKKNLAGFGIATGVLILASQVGLADWLSIEGIGAKADKLLSSL